MQPGDDAAVLSDGTAISTDTLVEGVHFDGRLSPADAGYKALAVSVSDLASMGARPSWCTLNLSLPRADDAWIAQFARGLADACEKWQVDLIGGDTTRTAGPIVISLTLGGPCVGRPVLRCGAGLGDAIWITGVPGLAGLGWRSPHAKPASLATLRRPDPPLDFALDLASHGWMSAAMDLSDGLSSDLPRLLRASGVGGILWPTALPDHPDLRDAPHLRRWAQLAGGDDYQLLFTAAQIRSSDLLSAARRHGVRLSCIGSVRTGVLEVPGGWPEGAFQHFGDRS